MLAAPERIVDGEQTKEETAVVPLSVMVAALELLPSVAVMVADCVVVREPAVALNVAEVAPEATVTDVAVESKEELLERDTVMPALGAA